VNKIIAQAKAINESVIKMGISRCQTNLCGYEFDNLALTIVNINADCPRCKKSKLSDFRLVVPY